MPANDANHTKNRRQKLSLLRIRLIRVIRGLLLDGDLIEDGAQLVEIHRFDQVKIESRFFAATDVLVCSEASESNGFDRLSPFCFGNYVIPSAVGKANVAQDDIEFL